MNNNKISELEALLFYSGDPISRAKIAGVLNIKKEKVDELLYEYKKILDEDDRRGLSITKKDDYFQLITKPDLSYIFEDIIKEEIKEELTPAVLEVLTIVAYLGPIQRSDIDFIRGVNSSYTLRNLVLRGLINKNRKGNTYEYSVTIDFLKHLGLDKMEDLPEFDKYKNILEDYEVNK